MGEDTFTLEFSDDGKLTLDARGVPLGTLLTEIQAQTKMAYEIGKTHYDNPVSLHFRKLPLQEAIKRILKNISYACIYNATGHIEKIVTISNTDGAFPNAPRHHESTVKSEPEASTSPASEGVSPSPDDPVVPMPPPEVMEILSQDMMPAPPPDAFLEE